MLTADGTAAPAAAALRLGAFDYLLKPVDRQQLLQTVQRAAATQRVAVERREAGASQEGGYRGLIGESAVMRRLYRQIERVGASEVTVLVQGESGTGKELVAKALHLASPRAQGPFVPINCAAVPETLQESELFGHERGAFTGASARRTGRFEQASGGTLFLDEVAELDLGLQAKLLRVLQERTFFRVGGTEQIQVDVRVVAATHKDLRELASEGKFREDLYYRLAVFELDLPALRQRREDLPALVRHFMALLGERHQRPGLRLSEEANQLVLGYAWPGNVRELQNALERAVVGCLGDEIEPEDLPRRLREGARAPALVDLQASSSGGGLSPMEELERAAIAEAIRASEGNMSDVIRRLGIPRTTLYRKLRRYGLR
jgi:DNA-binding NtrC family response regulator